MSDLSVINGNGLQFLDIFSNGFTATPLQFNQSMTTSEFLSALEAKINELVTYVNNIVSTTNEYTDSQVATINITISSLRATMFSLNKTTKEECNEYSDGLRNSLLNTINSNVTTLNLLIDGLKLKDSAMQSQIDELFNTLNTAGVSVLVINPVSGTLSTIQDALSAVYNKTRSTVTWGEIETVHKTWAEVEAFNRTWSDFEANARTILGL